jgi:hypothetical protein
MGTRLLVRSMYVNYRCIKLGHLLNRIEEKAPNQSLNRGLATQIYISIRGLVL